MTRGRSMALWSRVALATGWSGCLVVLGLWCLIDGAARLPARARVPIGLASIAAGLFLLMTIVADRLFPAAGRRLSIWLVEMATFLVFFGGCGGAVGSYDGGDRE